MWRDAVIKILHKNEELTECGNYRGTSLTAHAVEVLLKVAATRLSAYRENIKRLLPEEQCGFRPYRFTADMSFPVRRLQELATEERVSLFLFFIHLQEAHDSVDHTLLWRVLARFGVPPQMMQMIKVIRQVDDGMGACLRNNDAVC